MKKLLSLIVTISFIVSCTKHSRPSPTTVTDIDGNVYETEKIGNQIWMKENLRTSHYRNGDTIPVDFAEAGRQHIGASCWFLNNSLYKPYGRLYNWWAANDQRGLAPEGYHIPSDSEVSVLSNYLGGGSIAGGKMKETGLAHWESPNTSATNSSGFSALGSGGYLPYQSAFIDLGKVGIWWTITPSSFTPDNRAVSFSTYFYEDTLDISYIGSTKYNGLSVRCIKD